VSYVENNLLVGESMTYRARLHWIIFLKGGLFVLAAIVALAYLESPYNQYLGGGLFLLAIVYLIIPVIEYYSNEFAVTNKRLIVKTGLIRIDSLEILLSKVEGIQVNQTILGRILGYGSITITGTGGSRDPYLNIAEPLEFRKKAQEQISIIS